MSTDRRVITVCGWCPTELPDDWQEVAHHFLIRHGISNGSNSLRFFYPDDIGDEFAAWSDRAAVLTRRAGVSESPEEIA